MGTENNTEAVMAQMDEAAESAGKELKALPAEHVATVAQWWNTWYPKAGHKRLGRILAEKGKSPAPEKKSKGKK